VVNLNDLLHRLRRYPVTSRSSRIRRYDDAALEAEGEGCGAVGDLDGAVGIGVVVCHCAEPCRGLRAHVVSTSCRELLRMVRNGYMKAYLSYGR
jgi:hypothetical protein